MSSQPAKPAAPQSPVLVFLDQFMKLLSTTNGRDKLSKLLQYGSKVAAYQIETSATPDKMWIDKITKFEGAVGSGRKVTRFFRFLPGYIALIRLTQKYTSKQINFNLEFVVEVLELLKNLATCNYFLFDSLNFFSKLGILSSTKMAELDTKEPSFIPRLVKRTFNNEQAVSYNFYSNWYWFASLILALTLTTISFVRGFEKETKLLRELYALERAQVDAFLAKNKTSADAASTNAASSAAPASGDDAQQEKRMTEIRVELKKVYSDRNGQFRAFVRDSCDMGVAMNLLNWISLKKGTVGILGCISALIGAYEAW